MPVIRLLLRGFSFLFHGVLALFLLAISGLTLSSGTMKLHLPMLPWSGDTLTFVIFFGALAGLLGLILALGGKVRVLFFLWALFVAVMLTKGYVFSGYAFAPDEVKLAGYLLLGSWLAAMGAWPPKRRPGYR